MEKLQRAKQSTFVRHNVIFFFGSIAVGALNYVYYPILGRMLPPAAFGEVQALVSFFLQLSIFLTVLGLVTVNITANYTNERHRNRVIFDLERIALGVSLVLLLLSIIFSQQLQAFFQFDNSWPFVVLVLAVVVSVPFTFRNAFVRGQHSFGIASISNLIASGSKIIFSVALVGLGLSTIGAIWGVAAAQFLALIYIAYWAKRIGLTRDTGTKWTGKLDMSLLVPELKYAGLVLITSLLITLQFSIDILVVKHYFDAHTAGLYAGIATVARIIFFLTGSISQVLMPSVKLHNTAEQNRQLLTKSFYMLMLTGLPALFAFVLAPELIIQILMGNQYLEYAHMLPLLSVAIFIVSVMNLVASYYMALRKYAITIVVIIGAIVTNVLMITNHDTLYDVINNLLYGSLSMLLLIFGITLGNNLFKKREERQP